MCRDPSASLSVFPVTPEQPWWLVGSDRYVYRERKRRAFAFLAVKARARGNCELLKAHVFRMQQGTQFSEKLFIVVCAVILLISLKNCNI